MKPPAFAYRRAGSVAEAVAALSEAPGRARLLAGGQTLVQELAARTTTVDTLVDIDTLPGLDHVVIEPTVVRVGALCRIATLERHAELADALPALVDSAARVAHPAIRNRGTIGGNVAHADPASGIPPVLLALDGEVVLVGPAGERTVPATEFFTGYRQTAAASDEIITEVRFARTGPRSGSAFAEISRRARGWGLAGACTAVRLDGSGAIEHLRIGLLALAPTARRAEAAERAGIGRRPEAATAAELAELAVADLEEIPSDRTASATLRRSLGRVSVRRALTLSFARALGG